jgi:hypothetical protein
MNYPVQGEVRTVVRAEWSRLIGSLCCDTAFWDPPAEPTEKDHGQ